MSKPKYYLIFEVFVPKGQIGFNFKVFQFWGFLPHFVCQPIFSGFFGMMLVMDLDDLFGYQSMLTMI
jgi:hypothetical protein